MAAAVNDSDTAAESRRISICSAEAGRVVLITYVFHSIAPVELKVTVSVPDVTSWGPVKYK